MSIPAVGDFKETRLFNNRSPVEFYNHLSALFTAKGKFEIIPQNKSLDFEERVLDTLIQTFSLSPLKRLTLEKFQARIEGFFDNYKELSEEAKAAYNREVKSKSHRCSTARPIVAPTRPIEIKHKSLFVRFGKWLMRRRR